MAMITPYKIATRTWSHNTMGSDAKLSYSTGNDCLTVSDINQDSSRFLITPSSAANGAIPSSFLANSNKCITQVDLDDKYYPHYVNIDTIITDKGMGTTVGRYKVDIIAHYANDMISSSTTFPTTTGILKDINVNVSILCWDNNTFRASTSTSGVITASHMESNNRREVVCLSRSNGALTDVSTGTLTPELFVSYYAKDMYNYYNSKGVDSSFRYDIVSSLTPEYGVLYNSIFKPQKYLINPINIVTTTNVNTFSCAIDYTCTSGSGSTPLVNQEYTWGYTVEIYNVTPDIASSPSSSVTISTNKGTISRNDVWNGTTKKLTITGFVTHTPLNDTNEELFPNVKVVYSRSSFRQNVFECPVNITVHTIK